MYYYHTSQYANIYYPKKGKERVRCIFMFQLLFGIFLTFIMTCQWIIKLNLKVSTITSLSLFNL